MQAGFASGKAEAKYAFGSVTAQRVSIYTTYAECVQTGILTRWKPDAPAVARYVRPAGGATHCRTPDRVMHTGVVSRFSLISRYS